MERGRFSAGTSQASDPPVSLLLVIQDLHVSRELKLRLNIRALTCTRSVSQLCESGTATCW